MMLAIIQRKFAVVNPHDLNGHPKPMKATCPSYIPGRFLAASFAACALSELREVRLTFFDESGERFLALRGIQPVSDFLHFLAQRPVHLGMVGLLHQPLA